MATATTDGGDRGETERSHENSETEEDMFKHGAAEIISEIYLGDEEDSSPRENGDGSEEVDPVSSPTPPIAAPLPLSDKSYSSGDSDCQTTAAAPGSAPPLERSTSASIVDGLLCELYDKYHCHTRSESLDSDAFTECSTNSDRDGALHHFVTKASGEAATSEVFRLSKPYLLTKSLSELVMMVKELQPNVTRVSARLIKELKRRDRSRAQLQKNQDIITAILQAVSQKRRIDASLCFSVTPPSGKNGFKQWEHALKALAQLPHGLPPEFRSRIWLCLADNYIRSIQLNWEKTVRFTFNERSNPDDDRLGVQIVKDLHRTGCSGFGGEEDRVLLKRVLLAYARWNKSVGYCQGFNVLAALILEVVDKVEEDALKVMIYLIDSVLPESYFANNLRALSVDMAVFRRLLAFKLPKLARHLDKLQKDANKEATGMLYEPPLTNVFTMQWFLTLFATCLPKKVVLRIWDTVFLEGSQMLLRTALALWAELGEHVGKVQSADDFYCKSGELMNNMLNVEDFIDGDQLVKTIYTMAPVPFPQLDELREKFMYSITPFTPLSDAENTGSGSRRASGVKGQEVSDEEGVASDDEIENTNCFPLAGLILPPHSSLLTDSVGKRKQLKNHSSLSSDRGRGSNEGSMTDITKAGPGAFSEAPQDYEGSRQTSSAMLARMSVDVYGLKKQYWRIQQRQQQAHVIYTSQAAADAASAEAAAASRRRRAPPQPTLVAPIESPAVMNHLLVGKQGLGAKNKKLAPGPRIVSSNGGSGGSHGKKQANHDLRLQAHVNAAVKLKQQSSVDSTTSNGGGGSTPSPAHSETSLSPPPSLSPSSSPSPAKTTPQTRFQFEGGSLGGGLFDYVDEAAATSASRSQLRRQNRAEQQQQDFQRKLLQDYIHRDHGGIAGGVGSEEAGSVEQAIARYPLNGRQRQPGSPPPTSDPGTPRQAAATSDQGFSTPAPIQKMKMNNNYSPFPSRQLKSSAEKNRNRLKLGILS